MSNMFTPPRRRSPLRYSIGVASRRTSSPWTASPSPLREACSLTTPVRHLPRAVMEPPSAGRAASINDAPPLQESLPAIKTTAIQLVYDTFGLDNVNYFSSMTRTQIGRRRETCQDSIERKKEEIKEMTENIKQSKASQKESERIIEETRQQLEEDLAALEEYYKAEKAKLHARCRDTILRHENQIDYDRLSVEHFESSREKAKHSLLDIEAEDNVAEYIHFGSVNGADGPPKPYAVDDIPVIWDDLKLPNKAAVRALKRAEVLSKLHRCENLGLAGNEVLRKRFREDADFQARHGTVLEIKTGKSTYHNGVRVDFRVSELQDRLIDYLCYPDDILDDGFDENEDPILTADLKAIEEENNMKSKAIKEEREMKKREAILSAKKRRASRGTSPNGESSAKKARTLQA